MSIGHRFSRLLVVCVGASALVALSACNKKDDAPAPAGSATAATSAGPAAAKKPKATLKKDDLKSAYKAQFDDMSKMKDPMDKKVDAFVSKVGKPASDDGRKKTWYALDGDACTKFVLDSKDGSLTDSTTDKADCGL